MNSRFVAGLRLVVSLVWLYQGLWLKVITRDAHHLSIVASVGLPKPEIAMLMIGLGETMIGAAVLSGLFHRLVSGFQIILLLAMNLTGILFGGGNVTNPAGLLIGNLPLIMCILAIGLYGPGAWSLTRPIVR